MALIRNDLGEGFVLLIGVVQVRLEHKSGRRARLCVTAPDDVVISIVAEPTMESGDLEFSKVSAIG